MKTMIQLIRSIAEFAWFEGEMVRCGRTAIEKGGNCDCRTFSQFSSVNGAVVDVCSVVDMFS